MLKYLLLISVLALASNATPLKQTVVIGEKFYYITHEVRANWFEACNMCRQLGGFLVNLENELELQALSAHLHPSKSYWISINELGIAGSYASQATGRKALYLNWSAGQPDNIGGLEHCVELWRATSSFQMNDAQCKLELNFICELV